jgi:hypothetical protein
MSRLRTILGYSWAFLALPIILAIFIANDFWAAKLVTITGLKVSPWFTGGEVVQNVNHEQYRTVIHQTVFEGVIWQRSQGFVQINWQPIGGSLPQTIQEEIDYNRDGTKDFQIQLNTVNNQATLIPYTGPVSALGNYYDLGKEKAVRVVLKNRSGSK